MISGENNVYYNIGKYNCTFSKMIESWRNIWYTRTDSITDPVFPFGFVQVRIFFFFVMPSTIFVIIVSYQLMTRQAQELVDFLGFVGIKHLMLVLYQMTRYPMFLWQLH